jgi:hypothetical protein
VHADLAKDSDVVAIKEAICRALFRPRHRQAQPVAWRWLTQQPDENEEVFVSCCLHLNMPFSAAADALAATPGTAARAHLLTLRGLLAFDLVPLCLRKRHRVDYGIDNQFASFQLALLPLLILQTFHHCMSYSTTRMRNTEACSVSFCINRHHGCS